MKRKSTTLFCASGLLLALAAATGAQADELPTRKAGLWEMKISSAGMPENITRQCIDAAFEKEMKGMAASLGGQHKCSKQDIRKTSAGYVIDAVCETMGMTITSHTEFTGDFNSAYTMKQTGRVQGKTTGKAGQDTAMTMQAKWLGACPAGWKPGDIEIPGGTRINVKDMPK
ncbi:MAG: DUF3617 domain-containing protein [Azonexus sp.]|jgi:hypothetical protein|uniref:DUF3617 domain-containing protein n=1 Tax=Azonexus sp. TaxID=1872668 RepID=UPI00281979FE|nr:DUF3617 family protein [Azonexus sp.]MDR0775650.1 DUF3617 domain-containing protein [Azonexus sp.]